MLIPFDATCAGGQILVGASGTYSNYLSSLTGKCATASRIFGAVGGQDSQIGPFAGTGDFGANTAFDDSCPAGQAMTGMIGRSGDAIDAFGFRCTKVSAP